MSLIAVMQFFHWSLWCSQSVYWSLSVAQTVLSPISVIIKITTTRIIIDNFYIALFSN